MTINIEKVSETELKIVSTTIAERTVALKSLSEERIELLAEIGRIENNKTSIIAGYDEEIIAIQAKIKVLDDQILEAKNLGIIE